MISYAQNFEDVMLARIFGRRTKGFYVDVGAGSPLQLSVTKWFYDLGWCGINIEPNRTLFDQLSEARPRDINLDCGAGASSATCKFLEMPSAELSSFDLEIRRTADESGILGTKRNVSVVPLTKLLDQYGDGRHIDFLKIDVEGWEQEVLRGLDLERYRPTIILVEATKPGTRIESHSDWEGLLIEGRYCFAYFDGLNRFYLANEHAHLRKHFDLPPNVFDEITVYRLVATEGERIRREAELTTQIEHLKSELQTREAIIQRVDAAMTLMQQLIVRLKSFPVGSSVALFGTVPVALVKRLRQHHLNQRPPG